MTINIQILSLGAFVWPSRKSCSAKVYDLEALKVFSMGTFGNGSFVSAQENLMIPIIRTALPNEEGTHC